MQVVNNYFKGKLKKIKQHVNIKNQVIEIKTQKKRYVKCFHNFTLIKKSLFKEFDITHISTKDSSIESISNYKKKIFGLMWHPEREIPFKEEDKKIIKYYLKL